MTLKVKPIPEKCALVSGFLKSSDLGTFTELLRPSRLRPSLFVVNPQKEPGGVSPRSALAVNLAFEDSIAAVNWQIEHLREMTQQLLGEISLISGADANIEINKQSNFTVAGESVTLQATVPTSRCAEFVTQAQPLLPSLQAQPAVGLVTGHLPANVSIVDTTKLINQWRTLAASMGGHLTLPVAPTNGVPPCNPGAHHAPTGRSCEKSNKRWTPTTSFSGADMRF